MSTSLSRGLAALEAIGAGERSITAIAARLGVDKSSASRLVARLEAEGWVTREPGGPVLGPRAAVLGAGSRERAVVRRAEALAHLVAGVTGADVTVCVLSGRRGYIIATATGRDVFYEYPPILDPFPISATAAGQVMASFLDDQTAVALMPPEPYPAYTPRTVTSEAEFVARLATARSTGKVVEYEEFAPGFGCVAVPWHAPGSALPASIACVSSVERVREAHPMLARVLRAAAAPGASERSIIAAASRSGS